MMSQSPFSTKKFKALRDEWYKKLEQEGFDDIESNYKSEKGSREHQLLHVWESLYFKQSAVAQRFYATETYYTLCRQFSHEYPFQNSLDQKVWELHSEGSSLREIAKNLKAEGYLVNKDKVNEIVRQLVNIMKSKGNNVKRVRRTNRNKKLL